MAKWGNKIIDVFENSSICDVTILLADGCTVRAHRMVLKFGSDWFKTRLGENWDHGDPVNCTDFSAIHTRSVIEFMCFILIAHFFLLYYFNECKDDKK